MRTIGRTCLAIGAIGVTAAVALPATAADILTSRTYGRAYNAYASPYGGAVAYGGAYDAVVPEPLDYDGAYAAYDPAVPIYGHGYGTPWRGGSYYSYGASRANPSLSPNGWDQDNPRDQQLQGHN